MNKKYLAPFSVGFLLVSASTFKAEAEISLFQFALNKDTAVSTGVVPPGSTFDTSTGLGNIRLDFAGAGLHSSYAFFDHEMSEAVNTFFNELGAVSGAPSAGQSWEIDEPGFAAPFGDIYDNFLAGTLDNSIGTPDPNDVSMAMGWNFILGPGEIGQINFLLATTPLAGFHLRHFDPASGEELFLASTLLIRGPVPTVPEGGAPFAYAALSAAVLFAARRLTVLLRP
jgi:hypothetical protein